jgi:hypothetical protein
MRRLVQNQLAAVIARMAIPQYMALGVSVPVIADLTAMTVVAASR